MWVYLFVGTFTTEISVEKTITYFWIKIAYSICISWRHKRKNTFDFDISSPLVVVVVRLLNKSTYRIGKTRGGGMLYWDLSQVNFEGLWVNFLRAKSRKKGRLIGFFRRSYCTRIYWVKNLVRVYLLTFSFWKVFSKVFYWKFPIVVTS